MKLRRLAALAMAFVLVTTGMAMARGKGPAVVSSQELSPEEEAGLLHMRQEEKLAQDVYLALQETWGADVFANIASSEDRHMAAVKKLLDKYGVGDPVGEDGPGIFSDPYFQGLYDELVAAGSVSVVEAFRVGAMIEDLDIYDLLECLLETDNDDITRVYLNLVRGSRNHLRAFVGLLELLGETYEAQHLTQEEVDEIVDSPRETGPYGKGKSE
jgi:hypothetical protein